MRRLTLQYVSDIHLEKRLILPLIPRIATHIALLGDIGNPYQKSYADFLKKCSYEWEGVIVIAGNHEYFSHAEPDILWQITQICDDLKIHFLNDSEIKIGNRRILGSTLWTSSSSKTGHYRALDFLREKTIPKGNLDTIILTHYLPSYQLIAPKYLPLEDSHKFYATDLEYLMENRGISHWLCGHSHSKMRVNIRGVDCRINAIGAYGQDGSTIDDVIEL